MFKSLRRYPSFAMNTYSYSHSHSRTHTTTQERETSLDQSIERLLNYTPPKKKRFQVSGVFILYFVLFFHRLTQFCLTWSLQLELLSLLQTYENIFSTSTEATFETFISIGNILSYGLGFLLAPIFGYLADAYWGRFRVILASLFLLTFSLMSKVFFIGILTYLCPQETSLTTYNIASTNQTFPYFTNFTCFAFTPADDPITHEYVLGVFAGIGLTVYFLASSVSYSGLFANFCPFFVDQVEGSSETVLTTLFHKYYWVSNLGSLTAAVFIPWLQYFNLGIPLVISILSNITSIIIFIVFRKKFISQPPHRPYPLSLIKKVVLSSFRRRDEDERSPTKTTLLCYPTQILDRAKISNEGRFQVETVEDSKAFFRLLAVFMSFIGIYYIQIQALGIFSLQAFYLKLPVTNIYQESLTYSVISNGLLIFDPLIILIAQPILILTLRKLGPWAPNLLQRMGIGYVLGLLAIAAASLVDVLRVGIPCEINLLIQIPQYILVGLSESIGIVSHLEFTYAQSPYTMKGLLFGFMQLSRGIGIYILLFFVIFISRVGDCGYGDITDLVKDINCTNVEYNSCLYYGKGLSPNAMYFWLMNFIIALMGLPLFIYVSYRYSQRRRHYTD